MELLYVCLTTTYFQFEDKFYQQKDGMAMGNSLSPVVSNIFMEHLEEMALDTADHKPAEWLRNVVNTFVVWQHGPARQNYDRNQSRIFFEDLYAYIVSRPYIKCC
jgi:hypothetical protein